MRLFYYDIKISNTIPWRATIYDQLNISLPRKKNVRTQFNPLSLANSKRAMQIT